MSRAGELKPIHASAIGKALLTTAPADERADLVKRVALPAVTGNTITGRDELLAEIAAAEARGWSQTRGENVAAAMAMAVPFKVDGAASEISIAGPIARMEPLAAPPVAHGRARVGRVG